MGKNTKILRWLLKNPYNSINVTEADITGSFNHNTFAFSRMEMRILSVFTISVPPSPEVILVNDTSAFSRFSSHV